jgi:hypothetical protein
MLWALSACTRDSIEPGGVETGDKPVIMNILIPRGTTAGTRAITAAEENAVRTVDVLAFRVDGTRETFLYSATGSLSPANTPGSATLQFVATLRQQDYQQRLVVITNAHEQVSALVGGTNWVGSDKATMLAGLRYSLSGGQDRWNATSPADYLALPMWGESTPEIITASTRNLPSPVCLMRMVARIDVQLDNNVAGLTGLFKMKSVGLYNTNTGGRIVPDAASVVDTQTDGTRYLNVTAPTVPTDLQPYASRRLGPVDYTDFTAPGATDVAMTGAIYTFETSAATASAEATCLVVGGLYDTDTTPTYYRVEFYAPGTTTRLDILRNHRYLINIASVAGRGHATPAEAFSSNAVNMTANILVWNQPSLDNIVFDGQNSLAVTTGRVALEGNVYSTASAGGENVVSVYTDVPDGWQIVSIVDSNGTSPSLWLNAATLAGPGGTTTDMVIQTMSPNGTDADRPATITIAAGRLRLPIVVTQSNHQPIDLQIVDVTGQPIDEIVFSGAAGIAPAARSFTVRWLPLGNPVTVVANQVGQYEFPNHGSTPPSENGAPYQGESLTSAGTHTYTVAPLSLTTAELATNPFIIKSTRFDFTVNNGFTTMTKSITLTQLNYALVVEPNPFVSPYFPMGGSYSYRVRSNANWRISNVVEHPRVAGSLIAPPTGTDNVYIDAAGAPNFTVGGGFVEQFRANPAAKGNSGYVDVIYSSTASPAAFAPVTRRLFFPAAPFVIYGIASMPDQNANRWNYYSGDNGTPTAPQATNDIQTMAITAANYGTNLNPTPIAANSIPSSTVFVPPILVRGYQNNNTNVVAAQRITEAAATNPDMLVISGSSTFDRATADMITENFLKRDKTVFLCLEDVATINAMFESIKAAGFMTGNIYPTSSGGPYGAAPVYWFYNVDDPILNGPFMKSDGTPLRGNAYWGQDTAGSSPFWFTDMSGIVSYSNAENQSNTTDPLPGGLPAGSSMGNGNTAWRFTRCPLVVVTDGGFLASYDQSATDRSPSRVNTTTKYPGYAGNYGSGGTRREVYNAVFAANVTAWAIQRRTTQ